jgi:GTPase
MFRAGYVGLVGLPNAGKSTLLNAIVGEKVAIVTPKPQTTRGRVVGIHTTPEAQLCFVDAPGLIRAEKGLNKFLVKEFDDVIEESDVLIAVLGVDESRLEPLLEVAEKVKGAGKPWLIVITKTDLPLPHRARILREKMASFGVPVLEGSAERGEKGGASAKEFTNEVVNQVARLLPESPGPLFDPELFTTQSTRELAAELIREQCFLQLHEEIPYGIAVRMRQFAEDKGPTVRIEADIVLNKENHKQIVIGRGGQKLKLIGETARKQIEKLLGRPVYLGLHVVSRPKWTDTPNWLKELGYGLP